MSSGCGAVKGWCSASSRCSPSFHSNMGKSTTQARRCWPSCSGAAVGTGGKTSSHQRWEGVRRGQKRSLQEHLPDPRLRGRSQ
jgi:hypothetical protein